MRRFRAFVARQVLRLNPDLRDQLAAFGSHFTLNLSLFAIVIVASFLLEPAEFARLSLASNYIMLGVILIDFGLSSAALKLSVENKERYFVEINLALRAGQFLFCLVMLLVTAALAGPVREVIILSCAAGSGLWFATRIMEQYDRRFLRYAALNLGLAASRILFGGFALLTKSWVMIVLALHVVALLPIYVATLTALPRQWTDMKSLFQWSKIRKLLRIGPAFLIWAGLYSAIPIITQTAIYLGGDIAATGAFGIVVLLIGPIALLTNTLRIYLQPQIILKSLSSVDAFGLGPGSLHILVAAYAGLLLLGVVPASFVAEWVYEERFPQVGTFFLIYGSASCIVDAFGFYNIRALRGDLVWVGLSVNVLRAALVALLLVLPQIGALAIVIWSALVLLGGELLLCWLLTVAGRAHRKIGTMIPE